LITLERPALGEPRLWSSYTKNRLSEIFKDVVKKVDKRLDDGASGGRGERKVSEGEENPLLWGICEGMGEGRKARKGGGGPRLRGSSLLRIRWEYPEMGLRFSAGPWGGPAVDGLQERKQTKDFKESDAKPFELSL